MPYNILIISNNKEYFLPLYNLLIRDGYEVVIANSGEEGLEKWISWNPDLIFIQQNISKGFQLLKLKEQYGLTTPIVIFTLKGSITYAVKAIKNGAVDYLVSPFGIKKIRRLLINIFSSRDKDFQFSSYEFIGKSKVVQDIFKDISIIKDTDTSVLITGETGTGKEIIARMIHKKGNRRDNAFIKVNCAAIPQELLESELFGYKRGAFTGAVNDTKGRVIEANNGILFLDEIGDMPISLQPKILNVVEEKRVTPVGNSQSISCNIKIISATNQDLNKLIEQGRFRQDLFYRLNAFHIHIPPLRERLEDIPYLIDYFLRQFCNIFNKTIPSVDSNVLDIFKGYNWRGNVRELRNVIERIALKFKGKKIDVKDIPSEIFATSKLSNSKKVSSKFDLFNHEKRLILEALKRTRWNQSKAANLLGITRNTLRYRMKKYGITNIIPA